MLCCGVAVHLVCCCMFWRTQNRRLQLTTVHQKLNLCHCSVLKGMIVLQQSFQVFIVITSDHRCSKPHPLQGAVSWWTDEITCNGMIPEPLLVYSKVFMTIVEPFTRWCCCMVIDSYMVTKIAKYHRWSKQSLKQSLFLLLLEWSKQDVRARCTLGASHLNGDYLV